MKRIKLVVFFILGLFMLASCSSLNHDSFPSGPQIEEPGTNPDVEVSSYLITYYENGLKVHQEKLESGISLAKAKFEAVKQTYQGEFDSALLSSPNNILGLEYTKALIKLKSDIKIYPMLREGDHNDVTLKKGITSATSIRQVLKTKKFKKLKKCGFENNLIEANGYFYAKDEDGYYAEIVYKNNILTVTIDR